MRSVYVLRHGKSDWSVDAGDDFGRPLAPRGVDAARGVGRFLTANDQVPDRIVSSPATRARTTASLANESGAWKRTIAHEASLYLASGPTMVEVLRQQPADATRTLIVGHEPGCSALIAGLVGGARVRFPTAALARIDFEVDAWSSVQPDAGALQWLVVPRLLAAYAAALGG